MNLPTVSIDEVAAALVNWNSAPDTLHAIRVLHSLYPSLMVVVVDNDSQPDDFATLQSSCSSVQGLKLIRLASNVGYGGGMNVAMRAAQESGANFAWLLNPDAFPAIGALEALLDQADGAVALSPRQATSPSPSDTYCSAALLRGFRTTPVLCPGCEANVHAVDVVTGTGLLLSIAAANAVGGFDRSYFHYKEEFDLVKRMSRSGAVRLVCSSLVIHRRGGSLDHASALAHYYATRNELLYLRKSGAPLYQTLPRGIFWSLKALSSALSKKEDPRESALRARYVSEALWHGWRGRGGRH